MLRAEAAHFAKLKGEPIPGDVAEPERAHVKRQLENGSGEEAEEDLEAKRQRILEETRDIDADSDSAGDDDSSDDDRCVVFDVSQVDTRLTSFLQ